jgi:hypothetical protein
MAVPFPGHYFYGKISSLYLIGTDVQNIERTRELFLIKLKTSNLFAVAGNMSEGHSITL